MTEASFKKWLDALGSAWKNRDPKAAAKLCSKEKFAYFETPFDPPYTTHIAIEKLWEEVPETQKDIAYSYEILSVTKEIGVARWKASFTRMPSEVRDTLDGIYTVKLDKYGLCKEFHQWWVTKPRN